MKQGSTKRISWTVLAEQLEYAISSGRFPVGSQLPSEYQLSEEWNCSRATLRCATRFLVSSGRLYRKKSGALIVAKPIFRRNLTDFEPLWYFAQQKNRIFTSHTISLEIKQAPEHVAGILQLDEERRAYQLCRVRYLDGVPAICETTWLSAARIQGLERFDFSNESLFEILAAEYGICAYSGKQRLDIVYADENESALLQVPVMTPLFSLNGVTNDDYNTPVEVFFASIRSDQIGFACEADRIPEP